MKILRLIGSVLCGCMVFGGQVFSSSEGPKTEEEARARYGYEGGYTVDPVYHRLLPNPTRCLNLLLWDLGEYAEKMDQDASNLKFLMQKRKEHIVDVYIKQFGPKVDMGCITACTIRICITAADCHGQRFKETANSLQKVFEKTTQTPSKEELWANGIVPELIVENVNNEGLHTILTQKVEGDTVFGELLVAMCQNLSNEFGILTQKLSKLAQQVPDKPFRLTCVAGHILVNWE